MTGNQRQPEDDGKVLCEVSSQDAERFTLRIHETDLENSLSGHPLGKTVWIEYPNGERKPFCVVGILEPRREDK